VSLGAECALCEAVCSCVYLCVDLEG